MDKSSTYLGRFDIDPGFSPTQLLQCVNGYCDEAPRVLRTQKWDSYFIDGILIHPKGYENFTAAYNRRLVDKEYRLLTLRELLIFDLRISFPQLRYRHHPIIGLDFVLDFEPREVGHNTEVVEFRWIVRPVFVYHGSILEPNAGFAVTPRTLIDKGDWYRSVMEGLVEIQTF